MTKHYIFFTRKVLPQPMASLVQVAHNANAAANLGYPTVLIYLQNGRKAANPLDWFYAFRPRPPEAAMAKFYNIQPKLKVVPLSMPWPIDRWQNKVTNSSTIVSKYYFPYHILPHAQIVHTRDWNFVKAAIARGIPAIYEHHHHEDRPFEPEVAQNPLLQIAVTVADSVRDSMIAHGMPPDKTVKIHNGFNHLFLERHPQQAAAWRQKLLTPDRPYLAVYAGGLHKFKGVDLLVEVAQQLPQVQFAFAGGNPQQVATYQQFARSKNVENTVFLGHLSQDSLPSLLQAADVLTHPHCAGKEATFTSPLKLFDYMASGTPMVATEIPPLQEFQQANITAGWCEPDNPLAFAQCLQQVLRNYPRRVEGYRQDMEFVQQFSCENRIQKILSYVQEPLRPLITL
jgi:glycosyltransferase involved in cell wall biosynthesis